MKVLLDLNLSPAWIEFLEQHGIESAHWSKVGDLRAPDHLVMQWAREHGYLVFHP